MFNLAILPDFLATKLSVFHYIFIMHISPELLEVDKCVLTDVKTRLERSRRHKPGPFNGSYNCGSVVGSASCGTPE